MTEPLILWDETDRFLELLGRSQDVHAQLFPPKDDKASKGKALMLDAEGRRSAEALLAMPRYRRHSLGVRINPGGTKRPDITEGIALFVEGDGGLSLEEQEAIPSRLGMPCPTFTVWTGGKSLHFYWCATAGGRLSPEEFRQGQKRLIAAVKSVVPEAGVDEGINFPNAVMRAPGSLHPATGERCRIHSESGKRYDLTALVEMLPPLERKKPARKKQSTRTTSDDIAKAEAALSFLPPNEFEQPYEKWLQVGMALHSVSDGLIQAWTDWSRPMETFDEEEILQKWESFSSERDKSIGLGSLIRWAQVYGYRVPRKGNDDPSSTPPLSWSELIAVTLDAIRKGDVDAEMELRAEIAGRFKRKDSQIDAALFRLLTQEEAGVETSQDCPDSVDMRSVAGLDYLVDGFIPANGLALSYGAKGVGKTTAAVAMAFAVVDGKGFLDHAKPAKPGKVLFIASDSGAGPLRNVMQDMGMADHPALVPGKDQRFFVWAHEASQGHMAWDVGIRGCVRLLKFVKEKEIDLVVIDSAKAVCSKADISYADNDAVAALLTFMKEAIAPQASTLFLSHDGTAVGAHAGAKTWAEIVDVVHRQTMNEGDPMRTWTVVKNRLGPTRQFNYTLDDGELVLAAGVETIADASSAVLAVLKEAHQRGQERLSRRGLFDEVLRRFNYAPKTVENTVARLVQGKAPKVVRKGKGFYALSPKELSKGCLSEGGGCDQIASPAIDLLTPQPSPLAPPSGDSGQTSDRTPPPNPLGSGEARGMGTSIAAQADCPNPPPRGTDTPLDVFDSVEVFDGSRWANGWMVSKVDGRFLELIGTDGNLRRVPSGLARLCQAS